MKFSWKVFLCTLAVAALIFGLGSTLLISRGFQDSLNRETQYALDENALTRLAFESAAVNIRPYSGTLTNDEIVQIASSITVGDRRNQRALRVSDEELTVLYGEPRSPDNRWLTALEPDTRISRLQRVGDRYFIQTACQLLVGQRTLRLESIRDITETFQDRDKQIRLYRQITLLLLPCCALLMYLVTMWLIRPLRSLSAVTRRIADGYYGERAYVQSDDEIGQFADNFNAMADALECQIHELEQAAQEREQFVESFTHELKTPLTSMIGYSDMLRSKKLSEEDSFKAANYIFTEGRRLEALSLKLMELFLLRRERPEFTPIRLKILEEQMTQMAQPIFQSCGLKLELSLEDAPGLLADQALLKTLLLNLLDNARKASEPGGSVQLTGHRGGVFYLFTVQDYGRGMPREELDKITQPFYMVDKSRARAQNGAGLGLALCAQIAALHRGRLEFESAEGEGTIARFYLPLNGEERDKP